MNPVPDSNDWLEEIQRRRPSAGELAALRRELANRPRELARLEEEVLLNALLDGGPRPKAASNFTSRVLAAVAAEESRGARRARNWLNWLRVPRLALGVTAALAVTLGWWQLQLHRRGQLAASVSEVSRAAAVPGVAILQDFEAIQSFRAAPHPGDVALLTALNE